MDDSIPTTPADDRPLAGTAAATAPTRAGFSLRGRRWLYGATLAAAGVLAGSGVTYAVVSAAPTVQSQTVSPDGSGTAPGGGRGPMGAPPDGQAPQGQAQDGQAPGTEPSAGTGATT